MKGKYMKHNLYFLIGVLVLTFSACEQEIVTINENTDIPVVEAFLKPGQNISVDLAKMLPFTEDDYTEALFIDSAMVYISYKNTNYLLSPDTEKPGRYINNNPALITESGGQYGLFFDYNGSEVSASTNIPQRPNNVSLNSSNFYIDPDEIGPGSTMDPIIASWSNLDNSYHLIVVEYLETTYNPINEDMEEEKYEQFRKVSTEPITGESYNFNTRQHILFFGTYRISIYKVNDEYVDLYENISQSSISLTEPLTNIKNGLGIFTGMSSSSVSLEVRRN